MEIREVIQNYYSAIDRKEGWEAMVTDTVTIKGTGIKPAFGKQEFIRIIENFMAGVKKSSSSKIISSGSSACVLRKYEVLTPVGESVELDASEIVVVKEEKINSLELYFESEGFDEFMRRVSYADDLT